MTNPMAGGSGAGAGGFGGFPGGGQGGPGGFGGGRGGSGGFGGGGAAYASPIAIDFDGQRQYVQLTARALIGVAASDGKFLWRYDKPANRMGLNCSTALYHDGMVFASSAYGAGAGLVKLSKDANGAVKAEEVYATTDMQNHHGGMILFDGCLYGASGGNEGGASSVSTSRQARFCGTNEPPLVVARKVRWPWPTACSTIEWRMALCA